MVQPNLEFHYHGRISQERQQEIRGNLEECYQRLGRWLPEKVEVQVFDISSELTAFLEKEKAEFGIATSGDEAFICSHDAWQGFPRLLICAERLFALPPLAQLGALRHEVAHTVLHGGLVYYVVRIPPDCLELARTKNISLPVLQQLLYYGAIAVKDFEATRFLLRQGYQDCQVAFAQAQFSPSSEDEIAWLLAKSRPQAKLLFLTGQLKTLLFGWALQATGLIEPEKSAESVLHYLEEEERKRLLNVAVGIAGQLGEDTHENIRLALRQVLSDLA